MQTGSSLPCYPPLPKLSQSNTPYNPSPQDAPGAGAALGHVLENSIPLSIFPVQQDKLCVCFCGLPGRGKTQIARRLARYLSFFHGLPVQNFNVGEYRWRICGAIHDADWFNDSNHEAMTWRDRCNHQALSDCQEFLENVSYGVAILDGTNGTHKKRLNVLKALRVQGVKVMFVEIRNDSPTFLREQSREAACSMPDYQHMDDHEAAARDYMRRMASYVGHFEGLSKSHPVESNWSFIVCDHSQRNFEVHKVKGNVPLQVVSFVMNLGTTSHAIFLTRHGQSEYNSVGKIGGDSGLTPHGLNYARRLAEFVDTALTKDGDGNTVPARLWTSTMRRTIETAQFIQHDKIMIRDDEDPAAEQEWVQMRPRRWFHLDEIFAGSCDGMTYEEMVDFMPDEFELRKSDKLAYRYPRGESYLDVIARLQPVIIAMEQIREPLMIVGHQGILRIIYAFYMGLSRGEAPHVNIPLHTVLELRPQAFHCSVEKHELYSPSGGIESDGQDER